MPVHAEEEVANIRDYKMTTGSQEETKADTETKSGCGHTTGQIHGRVTKKTPTTFANSHSHAVGSLMQYRNAVYQNQGTPCSPALSCEPMQYLGAESVDVIGGTD